MKYWSFTSTQKLKRETNFCTQFPSEVSRAEVTRGVGNSCLHNSGLFASGTVFFFLQPTLFGRVFVFSFVDAVEGNAYLAYTMLPYEVTREFRDANYVKPSQMIVSTPSSMRSCF